MTGQRRRRFVVLVAALSTITVLSACSADGSPHPSPSSTPRPVTQQEAERLAVARFNTYDEHWVDVVARVPVAGETLSLTGRADMQAHEAMAVVKTRDGRWALLQWTQAGKAVVSLPSEPVGLPDPPADGWQVAPLSLDQPLDSALAVILDLASDRPENPLLLRQNGARWIRSEHVDDTAVDVFIAPGTDEKPNELVRYAVDANGILRRVTAETGSTVPLTITLTRSKDERIPLIPQLQQPAG